MRASPGLRPGRGADLSSPASLLPYPFTGACVAHHRLPRALRMTAATDKAIAIAIVLGPHIKTLEKKSARPRGARFVGGLEQGLTGM